MMTKVRSLLLGAALVAGAFGSFGAHAAAGCNSTQDKGHRTAMGSSKDGSSSTNCNGAIHCGNTGAVSTPELGDGTEIKAAANQTSSGGEVEACNDKGTGTTQGRLVVRV